jgi:hypothetical protein
MMRDPRIGCLCPCHGGLRVWGCSDPCQHRAPLGIARAFQEGARQALITVRDWADARARVGTRGHEL